MRPADRSWRAFSTLRAPRRSACSPRRSALATLLPALATLLASRVAHAETPRAPDPRVYSASPENPVMSIAWRSQLRGKLGVPIPLYGDTRDAGFALVLPAFVELHNYRPAVVPNQLWRGRLWLDASYGWKLYDSDRSPAARAGLAVEHESGHASDAGRFGFNNINSTSLYLDVVLPLGTRTTFRARVQPRFHFFTCTQSPAFCSIRGGAGRGSQAFELVTETSIASEVGARGGSTVPLLFASLYGSWLPKSETVLLERRVAIDVGGALAADRKGTFQLFGTALFGHDVGFFRGTRDVVHGGFGFRWTP